MSQNAADGQFDDAPEDDTALSIAPSVPNRVDPRANGTFIDDPELLEWSEPEDDFIDEEDEEGDEPGGVRGHGWGVFIPIVERVSWSWASVGVSCSFCTH